MEMFVLSYVNVLCIYPKLCLQVHLPNGLEPTWQTSMLYSDIVSLIYVNKTICMVICPSTRFKSIIFWLGMNHLVPRLSQNASYGEGPGTILSFKIFLSLINRLLVTTWHPAEDKQQGTLSAPFWCLCQKLFYLLYTLIKLCYTKALSDQASSLAPDWILLLRGPRIPALWFDNNLSLWERVWGKEQKGEWGTMTWRHSSFSYCISWSKYKSRLSFWLLQLDITNSSFSSSNIGTPNSEKDALTSQSSHQYHIELMKRFSSILGWHFFSPQFFTGTQQIS